MESKRGREMERGGRRERKRERGEVTSNKRRIKSTDTHRWRKREQN